MSAPLVLASRSAARRAMLAGAGVAFEAEDAGVDEPAIKAAFGSSDPAALAVELAKAKALAVSARRPGTWVLGSDQTLAFDGGLISKASSLDAARDRLKIMRGRDHQLHSGAALAKDSVIVWSGVDTARMRMRNFSDAFLNAYLEAEGEPVLASVGAYRLEGMGSQLFDRVEGDYFTVLGMPLWLVLAELRRVRVIAT